MSDDNNISTEGIIEERRKKLELLREENRAYLNNFSKNNNANEIHKSYESLSKEELEALFEKIMDEKINKLGKSIAESTTSQKNMNKLRGLSLDEFMKDNDKIIKDK